MAPDITIRVYLVDEKGLPVSGVDVSLYKHRISPDQWMKVSTMTTGAAGRVTWFLLESTLYDLVYFTCQRPGWSYDSPQYPYASKDYTVSTTPSPPLGFPTSWLIAGCLLAASMGLSYIAWSWSQQP